MIIIYLNYLIIIFLVNLKKWFRYAVRKKETWWSGFISWMYKILGIKSIIRIEKSKKLLNC